MKAELEKLFNDMRDKFSALVGSDPAAAKQEVVTKADAEALVVAAETAAKAEGYAGGLAEGAAAGKAAAETRQARAEEIMEICALAGLDKDALGYVKDRALTVEQVRAKVVETKAAAAAATQIRSTVGAVSTGEVDPLLADARQRAAAAGISVVKK